MTIDHEPRNSQLGYGRVLRLSSLWPMAVYTVYCSMIAFFCPEIVSLFPLNQNGLLQFGLVTGCGSVLLIAASL